MPSLDIFVEKHSHDITHESRHNIASEPNGSDKSEQNANNRTESCISHSSSTSSASSSATSSTIIYFTGHRSTHSQKLARLYSTTTKSCSGSGHLLTDTRFWDFTIEGVNTCIRYGNFDKNGEQKERAVQIQSHISAEEASKFISRIVQEKVEDGFVGWVCWG
ncbi:9448_t:CDS:1 [Ambispora gerdemannii]|uniref:9448_t:CDS:1 n=1 Tax=Ambispora gerdemannii TaxID=144530 RepID=A0A9N9BCZ0_9GLOM|nr:9448_t:CDS:1 [Ambispora gerdemannii]